ncbi:hypothetical protein [Microcoleus sp. bin38.metabat.b11b12b14.051]|nr:hypothetical protein [Microcoleus sp. bin38.metabat.b11b12b14.051]
MGIGHWALGMGHLALSEVEGWGIGHWPNRALGIGHWALEIGN